MLHGENNTPVVTRVLLILKDVATHIFGYGMVILALLG